MPSCTSLTATTLLALLAAIPTATAGCYKGDFGYNSLHGGDQPLSGEVELDINNICGQAKGKTISSSSPFWRCTDWAITSSGKNNCFNDCIAQCGTDPLNICKPKCDPSCDPGVGKNTFNHIDWAIEMRDKDTSKSQVVDYDKCVKMFFTEFEGCDSGSEQNHDGFWIRMDPNGGSCAEQALHKSTKREVTFSG